MKKLLTFIYIFFVLCPLAFAQARLVSVILITRHGDRTPFANIKNADYKWDAGLGELTPLGMQEEYQLGQKLRRLYVDKLKLLKPQYENNSIYTLSSNIDRTILSAECLLMGLYPPGTGPELDNGQSPLPYKFQPITIRSVPKNSSLILMPYPRYTGILKKYIFRSKKWLSKEAAVKHKFQRWSKILGNKITELSDILPIGDVLVVARHHHLPLPKGLTENDVKEILQLKDWALTEQFKSKDVAYLCGGELLNVINRNLKDIASGKLSYKLIYYSGHDITILPLMSLLGAPLDEPPGYASNMQIELYKNDNSHYTVKLRYCGKYIKLPIMKGKDYCTLEAFAKHVDEVNKQYGNLNPKAVQYKLDMTE